VIAKGAAEQVQTSGLSAFRAEIVGIAPTLAAHISELQSWDDVKLLTVTWIAWSNEQAGRAVVLATRAPMSPVGGVGINLAIQDAVATANASPSTCARIA